jgi:WD40 repeat protein
MYPGIPRFFGRNCVYNNQDYLIAISGNYLNFYKIFFAGGRTVITDDTRPDLQAFEFPVTACAISSNGSTLLAATTKNFQMLNTVTNEFNELQPLNSHQNHISQCGFFPGYNNLFVTASLDRTVKIWDIDQPNCLQTLTAHNPILCVAVAPDAKKIVAGTSSGDIYIWTQTNDCWSHLPAAKPQFEKHQGQVLCCVFSPDGSKMVSTATDQTLIVWNTLNWSILYYVKDTTAINCCVFSDDGQILYLGGEDGSIKYWNLSPPGSLTVTKLGQHKAAAITDCFFSANHRVIISRSPSSNEFSAIPIIDLSQPILHATQHPLELLPLQVVRPRSASPMSTPHNISRFPQSNIVAALVDFPITTRMPPSFATSVSSGIGLQSPHSVSVMDTALCAASPTPGASAPHSTSLPLPLPPAVTPPAAAAARSLPSSIKMPAAPGSSPFKQAAAFSILPSSNFPGPNSPGQERSRFDLAKRLSFEDTTTGAAAAAPVPKLRPAASDEYLRSILRPSSEAIHAIKEASFSRTTNRATYESFLLNGRGAKEGLLHNTIMSVVEEVRAGKSSTLAAQINPKKEIPNAHGGNNVSCSAIGLYATKSRLFGTITYIYIIASGGDDVRRWTLDPRNKKPVKTMTGHKALITCCGISADGKFIFSGDQDGGFRIRPSTGWNAWGFFTATYFAPKTPNHAILTKDNKYLVYSMITSTDDEQFPIEFVHRESMRKVFSVNGHTEVITGMVWLTETILLTSSLDEKIRIWDLKPDPEKYPYKPNFEINPTLMKTLAVGFPIDKFTATFANVNESGRHEVEDELENRILVYACVPQNSNAIYLLAEKDQKEGISLLKTLDDYKKTVTACVFSNNGLLLLSGHEDGTIVIWEVKTGVLLATKRAHVNAVQSMAFSVDSSLLISTGIDGKVIIWDTKITTLADEMLNPKKDFEE